MEILKTIELLEKLCVEKGIDDSHGVAHATAVLGHVDMAIAENPLPQERALAVRLAALLHDADDGKYSPETCETLANAKAILEQVGVSASVLRDTISMIKLVSCSKNGDTVPAEASASPEILWPRAADRLEAVGKIGVLRCYDYNQAKNMPIMVETTPRATTTDEVFANATSERYSMYQQGVPSMSMVDHYYDKLIHIVNPQNFNATKSEYMVTEAKNRVQPLLDVCVLCGTSGESSIHFYMTNLRNNL